LNAINGYTFNDYVTSILESEKFLASVNLTVTLVAPDALTSDDLNKFNTTPSTINQSQLDIINKLFNFEREFTLAEMNSMFEVKRSGTKRSGVVIGSEYKITLIAKSGFSINGTNFLDSQDITANVHLAITAKSIEEQITVTEEELALIKVGPQPITNSIFGIISKVFDINPSLEADVIKGLKVSRTDTGNPYTLLKLDLN
jgi:hypothetical protein